MIRPPGHPDEVLDLEVDDGPRLPGLPDVRAVPDHRPAERRGVPDLSSSAAVHVGSVQHRQNYVRFLDHPSVLLADHHRVDRVMDIGSGWKLPRVEDYQPRIR